MKSKTLLSRRRQADDVVRMLTREVPGERPPHDDEEAKTGHRIKPKDWSSLGRGERVTLEREAGLFVTGSIDDVASDGSVLWLLVDEGRGRTAVHAGDDPVMWRRRTHD